jgi:Zn-dependent peptidase ImmA (M78 family)/transcriptional regulator with XRE-family HTH domain
MISSEQLGERIAATRKRRKLTQAELAARLGVTRTTVVAMEKGERRPTSAELMRLSEILGVSVNELVREHAALGEVGPRFRMVSVAGVQADDIAALVERVRKMASRYVELERIHGIERSPARLDGLEIYRARGAADRLDPRALGQDAARTVRSMLGLGDAPAPALDECFEVEASLRIFYPDLGAALAALFFWSDELGPCIAINRNHPQGRRRWSFAHEIGHYLRDREAGDVLPAAGHPRMGPSELFAESFAAEFLLPRAGISRQFGDRCMANGGRFSAPDIEALAELYGASFQAMTRRLEDLGLLPRGTYDRLRVHKYRPRGAQARTAQSVVPLLPKRYLRLALQAYEGELISEGDLAEFLETDRVTARGIYLAETRKMSDDEGQLELPLSENLVAAPGQDAR